MKVLVACEESQVVCKEFRNIGHEAYSCDVLPCSGGRWEWHIRGNALAEIVRDYDMMIAFPPCTHLCVSGARWFKDKRREQAEAIEFFMLLANCGIPKIAIENPVGIMSTKWRKPDQYIQPWQFGHGETKKTGLWLKGLPKLEPTDVVDGREARIHKMPPSAERSKLRSKTFLGIGKAMAEQWG